jgi:hypothetical protein
MPLTTSISKGESSPKKRIENLKAGLGSGIDTRSFWAAMCPGRTVSSATVHECLYCGASAAVASPKLNRDWYFQCHFCGRSWNFLNHVKIVKNLGFQDASRWMVRNGVIHVGDSTFYARHSRVVTELTEILHQAKAQSAGMQITHYVPGELIPLPKIICGKLSNLSPEFDGLSSTRQLYAMVFRDILGVITTVCVHEAYNATKCLTVNVMDAMHHFFCPSRNGFKPGSSIWIASNKTARLVDLSQVPDQQRLLIERLRPGCEKRFDIPPEWRWFQHSINIITSPQTLAEDMQGFGSLMNFFSISVRSVDLDGSISVAPIAETIVRSEMFPFISGHLLHKRDLAEWTVESMRKLGAGAGKPDFAAGPSIQDPEPRMKMSVFRKRNKPRGNFSILCCSTRGPEADVVVSFGGARMMKVTVPTTDLEDSNKLYEAIVRAAIQNKMPFPIVYAKHPLPKDYLNDRAI